LRVAASACPAGRLGGPGPHRLHVALLAGVLGQGQGAVLHLAGVLPQEGVQLHGHHVQGPALEARGGVKARLVHGELRVVATIAGQAHLLSVDLVDAALAGPDPAPEPVVVLGHEVMGFGEPPVGRLAALLGFADRGRLADQHGQDRGLGLVEVDRARGVGHATRGLQQVEQVVGHADDRRALTLQVHSPGHEVAVPVELGLEDPHAGDRGGVEILDVGLLGHHAGGEGQVRPVAFHQVVEGLPSGASRQFADRTRRGGGREGLQPAPVDVVELLQGGVAAGLGEVSQDPSRQVQDRRTGGVPGQPGQVVGPVSQDHLLAREGDRQVDSAGPQDHGAVSRRVQPCSPDASLELDRPQPDRLVGSQGTTRPHRALDFGGPTSVGVLADPVEEAEEVPLAQVAGHLGLEHARMELAKAPVQGAGVGRADRASLSGQVQQAGAAFRGHPLGEIAHRALGGGASGLGRGAQHGPGAQFTHIRLGSAGLEVLQGGLPQLGGLVGSSDALQALDDGQEVRGVRGLFGTGARHVPGRELA